MLSLLFGYLLGSIPFGLLLTRAAGLGDVRAIGSGNIGATNVLRTGNKALAAATLLLDGLKGTAAVLIAPVLFSHIGIVQGVVEPTTLAALLAGLGAFLGHIFPIWLKFKGGKGVATYIGVLFGLLWPQGLLFCGIWLLVAIATRYSSLAALVAAFVAPFGLWFGTHIPALALCFAAMTAMLFYKHRENIQRLMAGTESRIGAKAATPTP